jgi:predicted  nucleic acid-binding Zn-ribbon protein
MKQAFKKRLKKVIFWLIIVFVVLFIFRLMYGYTKNFDDTPNQTQFFDNISNSKRNYATKKYEVKSSTANQSAIKVDQKYEKIAEIKTKSSNFEKEEKSSRETIKKLDALIQFEQKSGNKGYRKLNLVIGVPPENFDVLYNQLITIGKVQAKQITKKDKTNEYKELNAKKQSLEKIRTSLIELKSKGGKIDEYMGLENRILEIEQQLQGLGVSLGDFDDENEFCTVKFSLLEGKEVKIGIMQRVKIALEWTVKIYLRIMTTLFFLTLFAYFILLGIEKLKYLSK